jgi:hypothetical protein
MAQAMQTFASSQEPWAFNLMLRFLEHITGDMHQPLHSVGGYFNDRCVLCGNFNCNLTGRRGSGRRSGRSPAPLSHHVAPARRCSFEEAVTHHHDP